MNNAQSQRLARVAVSVVLAALAGALTLRSLRTRAAEAKCDLVYLAAAQRGLAFIRSAQARAPARIYLGLDYLQRRYKLDPSFRYEAMIAGATPDDEEKEFSRLFERLVSPAARPDLGRAKLAPPIDLMLRAVYCDSTPLPKDFPERVKKGIVEGGWGLSHVAYAVALVDRNGCSRVADAATRAALIDGMMRVATASETTAPVRYQTIAMLQELGEHQGVAPLVAAMGPLQKGDGGFSVAPELESDPATTSVAVWALLGAACPHAREISFRR